MFTVAQAAEKIIHRSRYLSEAISKGLINTSALARYIKPEIDEMLTKKVSEAAILMAINRLSKTIKPHYSSHTILHQAPQILLRSQLSLFIYQDSPTILCGFAKYKEYNTNQNFLLFAKQQHLFILCSNRLVKTISQIWKSERLISEQKNISAVTIFLPKETLDTPGIYYFFLKSLAWEGINILEIVSMADELTLVFEEKDATNALKVIQSLFNR